MAARALQFFDAHLKPGSGGRAPAPGAVTAFLQSCPRTAARGGGPVSATSFARLARGALRLSANGRQSVSSSGGDAGLAGQLSPLRLDPCTSFRASTARGTAVVTRRTSGFTLLGRTTISARVRVRGARAQLVGRLWDLDPSTGRQRLIDRGVVRLRSARTVSFHLNGQRLALPSRASRPRRDPRPRRADVPAVERRVHGRRLAAAGHAAGARAAPALAPGWD